MYFSGVTFTSLGYGDVVLDGRMRLLAPLQAANGLMMFGITTALFIAAVQHAIGKWTRGASGPHARFQAENSFIAERVRRGR